MKLFYLNPNNYGSEWFVMSDSKQNAINAIIQNCKDEQKRMNNNWEQDTIDILSKGELPKGYTLDEYEVNQVIQSEIC